MTKGLDTGDTNMSLDSFNPRPEQTTSSAPHFLKNVFSNLFQELTSSADELGINELTLFGHKILES
jgi:hypothetical protein